MRYGKELAFTLGRLGRAFCLALLESNMGLLRWHDMLVSRDMIQHGLGNRGCHHIWRKTQKFGKSFHYYETIEAMRAFNTTQLQLHPASSANITFMRLGVCTHYQK